MAKKKREAKTDTEAGKTKDLKIISVQVITRDRVVKNPRQMGLLYIIDRFGPIHEKTLQMLAYEIQKRGAQLGYNFTVVAGVPYSPEFRNDLVALTYVGFVEVNPRKNRRLQVTSDGKEALEKYGVPKSVIEVIERHFVDLRNTAMLKDSEIDIALKKRRGEERTRRFPFLR